MKKLFLTSILSIIAFTNANSVDIKPYASLKIGHTINYFEDFMHIIKYNKDIKIKKGNAFNASISGGASFQIDEFLALRSELEYNYSLSRVHRVLTVEGKEQGVNVFVPLHTFLFDGYIDLGNKNWTVKPYLGAGIGYSLGAFQSYEGDIFNLNIRGTNWMGTIGATYELNKNVSFDLGVRYSNSLFKNIILDDNNFNIKLKNVSINLGARYTF